MRWLGLAIVLLLGAVPAAAAPLDAYGNLPSLSDFALSPDGKRLAYVKGENGQRIITIEAVDGRHLITTIAPGASKIRGLVWADDDKLLITVSNAQQTNWAYGLLELSVTLSYSVATGKFTDLLKDTSRALHIVAGDTEARRIGGRTLLFVPGLARSGLRLVLTMYQVDPDTGIPTQLELGSKSTTGYVVDDAGAVVARTDYIEDKQRWSLLLRRGGDWVEAYGVDATIETPQIVGWAADGKSILVRSVQNGEPVLKPLAVADGSWGAPLPPVFALSQTIADPATHRVIGGVGIGEHLDYVFFAPADQAAFDAAVKLFPGEDVQFQSWSADRKRIVVLVDGARDGSAYRLVDLATGAVEPLGPAYSAIAPSDIAPVKTIHYSAADGFQIPAFLTLPAGKPASALPLIVFPHGGPAARDMPGFDWWAQAMASRGYAVLQPQFRGSDGFGWAHLAAGFGQWGRKMQTDLSDGVRALAAQGIVDPKRVCIVGASYGGYAALAGATLDRGVYRCAVSVSGVSDPARMMGRPYVGSADDRGLRYIERFLGATDYRDPALDRISPLAHAADADIPILLMHGSDDTVVPFEQSSLMSDALYKLKKPVTFYSLSGEDHWLSRSTTRRLMLEKIVAFLEANNPPN